MGWGDRDDFGGVDRWWLFLETRWIFDHVGKGVAIGIILDPGPKERVCTHSFGRIRTKGVHLWKGKGLRETTRWYDVVFSVH